MFADSNAHPPHNVHNVHDAVFVVSGKALIKTNHISQRQVPLPFLLLHGCIQYVLNKPSIVATLLYTAHKCVFMLLLLPASQLFSLTAFYVGCSGTNLLFMEGSIIVFLQFLNGKLSSNPDLWRIGLCPDRWQIGSGSSSFEGGKGPVVVVICCLEVIMSWVW